MKFLIKRIALMVPTLIGITIISFTVMKMAPGDPTSLMTDLNPNMNQEAVKRIRAHYGLDQPWHIQYLKWLRNMSVLDFGRSFSTDNRPVIDKIAERIPITLLINILSMALILSLSIPIGVISAVKQDSIFDRVSSLIVFIGFAIPTFWL
ncbi:MAG: ABC transporter permease, partial [Desulfomonilaceae bacterium]